MIKSSTFSILIANFNNGRYFKDCYESLIAQTFSQWEAVIVDDCSTDDSVELIRSLVGEDSRFKIYINEVNSGVGYTKKRCIDLAEGEICGFIDPDDAVTPNAVELMMKTHDSHPNVSLVYSNFIYCDDQLSQTSVRKTEQINNKMNDFYNFGGIISHFATFKKSFYHKTSGLSSFYRRAIDQDLYLKLYDSGEVFHIDYDLYLYRIHNGGISTNSNAEKAFFWHWAAIINTAERRNTNVEDLFITKYAERRLLDNQLLQNTLHTNFRNRLKKSKWLKLGKLLGLFKNYDEL